MDVFDDVDASLNTWLKLFSEVIDRHLPWREKRVKTPKRPDWITNEILENIAQRDHFKSLHNEERYKVARNQCVNLVRNSNITYYKACI